MVHSFIVLLMFMINALCIVNLFYCYIYDKGSLSIHVLIVHTTAFILRLHYIVLIGFNII